MDRIDVPLIRSVFHPDAIADYGAMYSGTGYGFADFIAEVHPPMQTHTHHLSNIAVTVDGDVAGSECYVIMRARTIGADGTAHETVSHGRYVDRWERRDAIWRIAHRRYLHSLDELWTASTRLFEPAGSRGPDDPAYDVFPDPPASAD
ncbi:hypothetical protein J2S59_000252 [Nocardioides massiliensis]|uniref:SnoaL-like domain-containing protein n=1 Tax=Nocardioides massiliensis TaxID=1325935 RepID=A0ABT9NJ56_9ACTN|nr:hypothetical protein [Nocardioides massiliensis]